MFVSLMAQVLEGDVVDEVGGPSESGWRDTRWRKTEFDDSFLGSMLTGLLSPYSDAEEVDDEKIVEEREAEVTELDEMLAEQKSMEAPSRLDDDSNLVL